MLLEIHILQNHSPANLNRDDTGSPKECIFGGQKRARISSQCLKRSIRRSDIFRDSVSGELATRTRRLPELVKDRLIKKHQVDPAVAEAVAQKLTGFGTNEGKESDRKDGGYYETRQTMFLTDADLDAVTNLMLETVRDRSEAAVKKLKASDLQKEARQEGFRPITVDVALFGRMITSSAFRDVEASMQVAHAISTHKVDHEFDYFTAVDDLLGTDMEKEEDAGADMIGDVEFNSACFYKYFSLDVNGLIDNLCGAVLSEERKPAEGQDRAGAVLAAASAAAAFVEAAARVTPSGKQNTFASHTLPALILVEARPRKTPVSYANAFVEPARAGRDGDLVTSSINKLATHVEALTAGFNLKADPRLMLAPEHSKAAISGVTKTASLDDLCRTIQEKVCEL